MQLPSQIAGNSLRLHNFFLKIQYDALYQNF